VGLTPQLELPAVTIGLIKQILPQLTKWTTITGNSPYLDCPWTKPSV
jgi:hypothetical protein